MVSRHNLDGTLSLHNCVTLRVFWGEEPKLFHSDLLFALSQLLDWCIKWTESYCAAFRNWRACPPCQLSAHLTGISASAFRRIWREGGDIWGMQVIDSAKLTYSSNQHTIIGQLRVYLIPEKIWKDTPEIHTCLKIRLKVRKYALIESQDQRKYNVKVKAGET